MSESGHLEGRKAAVTGAGGFIGGAVARRLLEEGAAVRGLDVDDRVEAGLSEAGIEFVHCDVRRQDEVRAALADADLVVHTAAYVREYGTMDEFIDLNVRGTVNVLDAAEHGGAERIVHLSSVVVYGYDDAAHQRDHAFRRVYGIPYIDTKSASDRIACRRGAIVVRPGDVYGPGSSWVLRPLELARAGQLSVPHPGDGLMLPVYIADLVEAIVLALQAGRPGQPYAVWSGEQVTFREYFDHYAAMTATRPARRLPRALLAIAGRSMEAYAQMRSAEPMFTPAAMKFIDRRGTASAERIRDELGWEPRVSMDEGMARVERWARAEGLL
ncbi:MAG: NAD-dependent epimerase/dehydratase family protein [Solirubrobacterales bacterium]